MTMRMAGAEGDTQVLEAEDGDSRSALKELAGVAYRRWRQADAAYTAARRLKVSEDEIATLNEVIRTIWDDAQVEVDEVQRGFNEKHGLTQLAETAADLELQYDDACVAAYEHSDEEE